MLSNSRRAYLGESTGVLPFFTMCFGPRTEAAGFVGITWPTTSQLKRWRMAAGKPLLGRWSRPFTRQVLNVCRDVQRLHSGEGLNARRLAPRQELPRALSIGAPGVRISDIGGEELDEAQLRALTSGGDEGRGGSCDGEGDELVHSGPLVTRGG
jgi:hypothetical protein